MNLVTPNFEIWEQDTSSPVEGMWNHIARCTRVCYQSTPKNNGETDEEFVKRVILRPDSSTGQLDFNKIHGAMLEHGTVYLFVPWLDDGPTRLPKTVKHYCINPYSKENYIYDNNPGSYITTNLRVIYENGWLDDLKYICSPTEHHDKRVTVSFTTNIGVSREFNRHRVDSISEESTRYCNYSKDRFGKNITFCRPAWISEKELSVYIEQTMRGKFDEQIEDKNLRAIHYYYNCLFECQRAYNMLISLGWKPQQAREVLPLATKSQLIHTAFVDDWKHFFALRADGISGPPHPNAKLLAEPLKKEFIKRGLL